MRIAEPQKGAAALLAILLAAALVCLSGCMCAGEETAAAELPDGVVEVFERYVHGHNDRSGAALAGATMSEPMLALYRTVGMDEAAIEAELVRQLGELEERYGEEFRLRVTLLSADALSGEEAEEFVKTLMLFGGSPDKLGQIASVSVRMTYSSGTIDDMASDTVVFTVYEYDGEWFLWRG